MGERKSYDDTCRQLAELKYFETPPPMPKRMPRYGDDGPLGIQFYRTGLEEADLSALSLPRTFFGRSYVTRTSFRDTDLSESCLCWCDFTDVDFSEADLSNSDLRASQYERVSFISATLDGADLRRSYFADCRFDDASLRGAVLTHDQRGIGLSEEQAREISWTADDGIDPDGG